MTKRAGVAAAVVGSLAIAAVSTFGDFVWATQISEHRAVYGMTHGALLFLSIGLFLGSLYARPFAGAVSGLVIGVLAAGTFYLLSPIAGYSVMFVVWIAVWVAVGVLHKRLSGNSASVVARGLKPPRYSGLIRGFVAAVLSGATFYAISGIWRPFDPHGWDYAVHFGAWTIAYLPGFAVLLVGRTARSAST